MSMLFYCMEQSEVKNSSFHCKIELENRYTVHNFNFSGHGGNDFEIDFSIKKKS